VSRLLARSGEPLSDHLLRVAELAERLADDLRLGLGEQARIAGLLHDLGKGDSGAQEKYARGLGAPGHEIVSFAVAHGVLERLGLPKEDVTAILLAILRHHQAMATLDERLYELDRSKWFKGKANLSALSSIVSSALGRQVSIESWPRNREELLRTAMQVWQKCCHDARGDIRIQLRAKLLTGVLIVADYHVASASGGLGRRSRFSAELERFFESLEKLKRELGSRG
jgi:CRISPR-associated endonuclease Cas3-HD